MRVSGRSATKRRRIWRGLRVFLVLTFFGCAATADVYVDWRRDGLDRALIGNRKDEPVKRKMFFNGVPVQGSTWTDGRAVNRITEETLREVRARYEAFEARRRTDPEAAFTGDYLELPRVVVGPAFLSVIRLLPESEDPGLSAASEADPLGPVHLTMVTAEGMSGRSRIWELKGRLAAAGVEGAPMLARAELRDVPSPPGAQLLMSVDEQISGRWHSTLQYALSVAPRAAADAMVHALEASGFVTEQRDDGPDGSFAALARGEASVTLFAHRQGGRSTSATAMVLQIVAGGASDATGVTAARPASNRTPERVAEE